MKLLLPVFLLGFLTGCSSPAEPSPTPTIPAQIEVPTVENTPSPEPSPAVTAADCLSEEAITEVVHAYLIDHDAPDLNAVWQTIEKDAGGAGLMSSVTDYNNEFAHGTTWERLLLLGEYEAHFNIPGAEGILHCAVIAYPGGSGPEVGSAISDAVVNGEWSGYAYGLTPSEKATRDFMREHTGKAVTVRYHVSQNPEEKDFVRSGFFNQPMRLLWQDSYYTRIPTNLNILFDNVGQPRGPNLREMMAVAKGLGGLGVFLDYITEPIP